MSYVIHIWERPHPTSLRHAEELVGTLIRAPKTTEVNSKFAEAAKRLTAKYPFNEDPTIDVEGEVWSDGPLTPRRGEQIWGVGLPFQYVSEVQPFVVSVSNELGLVVYDMQVGKAYLPDGTALTAEGTRRSR
jgi:hypothetical protein